MSFVKLNLDKAGNGAGVSQDKDSQIVVFSWNDIAFMPKRDAKGIKLAGNILFKDGDYAIQMYATPSTISLPGTAEGEEDQIGRTSLPEFNHPGSTQEFEEFSQNMLNVGLGLAVRLEDDNGNSYYKIFGSSANPLYLMDEAQDNNEATKNLLKFQQFKPQKNKPARYYGTFTFDEANLVPADAINVDVAEGSGEYQLQDSTVATDITTLSNAVHGGVYTLIGSGGDLPATLTAAGDFILAAAADWQAINGAKITLQAYEQAAGFVFFEQSRS